MNPAYYSRTKQFWRNINDKMWPIHSPLEIFTEVIPSGEPFLSIDVYKIFFINRFCTFPVTINKKFHLSRSLLHSRDLQTPGDQFRGDNNLPPHPLGILAPSN